MADANTRPAFTLPFRPGKTVSVKSYRGHNPDDKKMDMYCEDWTIVASAPGKVIEHFYPGGIEIRHFIPGTSRLGNWYTTYMHMDQRAAIGTVVRAGDWVGRGDSVGTGVRHLHFEQLLDNEGTGNANTDDMLYPAFVEYNGGKPFHVPVGEPGLRMVSQAGKVSMPPVSPRPNVVRREWTLPKGHYYGHIKGPNESHGGYYANERDEIMLIQKALQRLGCAPRVAGWADGIWENPTTEAMKTFQRKRGIPVSGKCGHGDGKHLGIWK